MRITLMLFTLLLAGCNAHQLGAFAQAVNAAGQGYAEGRSGGAYSSTQNRNSGSSSNSLYSSSSSSSLYSSSAEPRIMIYGGANNKVFLGCYSCNRYADDSIFNTYGQYGSNSSALSIFNRYSEYGSKYSNYSICNPYAQNPPVMVDSKGGFYGYLTMNKYHAKVVQNSNIISWLIGVCSY